MGKLIFWGFLRAALETSSHDYVLWLFKTVCFKCISIFSPSPKTSKDGILILSLHMKKVRLSEVK